MNDAYPPRAVQKGDKGDKGDPGAAGTPGASFRGVKADEAAMLATSTATQVGDYIVRSDTHTFWILTATPYSTLANWTNVGAPVTITINGVTGTTFSVTPAGIGAATQAAMDIVLAVLATKSDDGHTHDATEIVTGLLAAARMGSGTANSGKVLYGDRVWRDAPSGGGATLTIKRACTGGADRKSPDDAVAEGLVGQGVSTAIIEVTWASINPSAGVYVFDEIHRQLGVAHAYGLTTRLRVQGGRNAPADLKSIVLFPDDSGGIDHFPDWNSAAVQARWAATMDALADEFDDDDRLNEVQAWLACTDFPECFQREQSSITGSGADPAWSTIHGTLGTAISTTGTGNITVPAAVASALPALPNASYPDGIPLRCEGEILIATSHVANSATVGIGTRGAAGGGAAATHAVGKRIGVEYAAQALYLAGGGASAYDAWKVGNGTVAGSGLYVATPFDHLTRGDNYVGSEYRKGLAAPYVVFGSMAARLNATIDADDTSFAVTGKSGMPASGGPASMLLQLEDERMLLIAGLDGSTWTVVRGVDDTEAVPHAKGTPFTMGRYVEVSLTTANFGTSPQEFAVGDFAVVDATGQLDHGGMIFHANPNVSASSVGKFRMWWPKEKAEPATTPTGGNVWRIPQWNLEWEVWKTVLAKHAAVFQRTRSLVFANPAQALVTAPGTSTDPGVLSGKVSLDGALFAVFDHHRLLMGERASLGNASARFDSTQDDELSQLHSTGYEAMYEGLRRRGPGGELHIPGASIVQQTAAVVRVKNLVLTFRAYLDEVGATSVEYPAGYWNGGTPSASFDSFGSVESARQWDSWLKARAGEAGGVIFPAGWRSKRIETRTSFVVSEDVTVCTATGAKTAQYPSADALGGQSFTLVNASASGNITAVIHTNSGDAFQGAVTVAPGASATFWSDGVHTWVKVA